MKKLVILLLLMSLLFSIVACATEAVTTTTEATETTHQPIVITKPAGETVEKPTDTMLNPFETEKKPLQTENKPVETAHPLETTQPVPIVTKPQKPIPSEPQDGGNYPTQLDGIKDLLEDPVVEIIYVEGGNGTYTADSIWVDVETVADIDAVDQQIIDRNNRIYEDLGLTIDAFTDPTLGISGLYSFAKIYFDLQDPGLDIYAGYQYFDISVATKGAFYNLNTIVNETGESLININKSYWATDYINAMTYHDQVYWVTGDLALRYTGGLYGTFVNLDLYNAYVKNNYEGKSIYDIVNEKGWTMQTMLDMAAMVYDDSDSNGAASANDRLGIVFEPNDSLDALAFGCRINFTTTTTAANQEYISVTLHTDKNATKLATYIDTMFKSNYAYCATTSDSQEMMKIFANGNALFAVNKLYQAEIYLMGADKVAIIPTPMLDEWQGGYATGVHDGVTIFGISRFTNCPIASAALLELMAYYSSVMVTDAYIEELTNGSEESIAMVELMRQSVYSNFGAAWSNKISNMVHVFRNKANVEKFDSFVKVTSRQWPNQLQTLLSELESLES